MGPYYREPMKSPGPLPTHLVEPLIRSFTNDHYVADSGDIVYYQKVRHGRTSCWIGMDGVWILHAQMALCARRAAHGVKEGCSDSA